MHVRSGKAYQYVSRSPRAPISRKVAALDKIKYASKLDLVTFSSAKTLKT